MCPYLHFSVLFVMHNAKPNTPLKSWNIMYVENFQTSGATQPGLPRLAFNRWSSQITLENPNSERIAFVAREPEPMGANGTMPVDPLPSVGY